MSVSEVPLGNLMAPPDGSVNPARHPTETFCLYSIPSFDAGAPELLPGSSIGSAKQIVRPGDVLLSRIVPHIRRAWIVEPQAKYRIIASGEWIVFRSSRVDPRYLRHFLTSNGFHRQFMTTVAGVGGSLLRARPAQVAQIRVPLPPSSEQRRIANILDKADAIRRKRKEAITLTETLLRSAFLEMFGDPVTNPKGWPVQPLGETFADDPRIGTLVPASEQAGTIVVRVGELGQYDVALGRSKRAVLSRAERERFLVKTGDVLLARAIGSEDHLGKASVLQSASEPIAFDSHVMRLRFRLDMIDPYFFAQWLRSSGGRRRFMSEAGRTAVQFNVNGKQIARVKIPLPPLTEQHRFLTIFSNARRCIGKAYSSLLEAEDLFLSLVQQAFW